MYRTVQLTVLLCTFHIQEEFENDNIDSTLINADEAFTKFKGTRLDSDNVGKLLRLIRALALRFDAMAYDL